MACTADVVAPGFVAVNITFHNTAGPSKFQAVAMRSGADLSTWSTAAALMVTQPPYIHIHSDNSTENATFTAQSTSYRKRRCCFAKLQHISTPSIVRPVRFYYRSGTNWPKSDHWHFHSQNHNCTIKAADDLAANVGTVKAYLGRPWKGSSTTVCYAVIFWQFGRAGWLIWSGDFALSTPY